MSTAIVSAGPRQTWASPATEPLDQAVWQAWESKGQTQERRSDAAKTIAVRWISIAGLLVAATLWSQLAPCEVIVRFMVAAATTVVMLQAFQAWHYTATAVFGACALLDNPIVTGVESFGRPAPRR